MTAGIPPVVVARLCMAAYQAGREHAAALAERLNATYWDDHDDERDLSWRIRHPAQFGDT